MSNIINKNIDKVHKDDLEETYMAESLFAITMQGKKESVIELLEYINKVKRVDAFTATLNLSNSLSNLKEEISMLEDDVIRFKTAGFCAISISHSMLGDYDEGNEEGPFLKKVKELDLDIEVFAINYIGLFEEHFLFLDGEKKRYEAREISIDYEAGEKYSLITGGFEKEDVYLEV